MFTKIPSAAREPERFLLRLVRAALAAVYATMLDDWRLVEWAEMFTMRAHDAERRRGSVARTHRAALTVPISKVACHSSSSTSSNNPIPTSTGPAALTRMLSDSLARPAFPEHAPPTPTT